MNSDSIIEPSLKAGAATGALGLLVGSLVGIVRSANPILFTVASGIQWFAVGAIYWGSRSIVLQTRDDGSRNYPLASGIAATIAGGSAGAIARGRQNVLPGAAVFGILGFTGQHTLDRYNARRNSASDRPILEQLGKSKWSPLKLLSNDEYKALLHEKLVRVDSEVAIIDENIEKLQKDAANSDASAKRVPSSD